MCAQPEFTRQNLSDGTLQLYVDPPPYANIEQPAVPESPPLETARLDMSSYFP